MVTYNYKEYFKEILTKCFFPKENMYIFIFYKRKLCFCP